jgi:hypothetical protein
VVRLAGGYKKAQEWPVIDVGEGVQLLCTKLHLLIKGNFLELLPALECIALTSIQAAGYFNRPSIPYRATVTGKYGALTPC